MVQDVSDSADKLLQLMEFPWGYPLIVSFRRFCDVNKRDYLPRIQEADFFAEAKLSKLQIQRTNLQTHKVVRQGP